MNFPRIIRPASSKTVTHTQATVGLIPCTITLTLLFAAAGFASAQNPHENWITTWQGSVTPGGTFYSPGCPSDVGLNNQTIRNIVHIAVGGDTVRARISNTDGANPLQIGSASIAKAGAGAAANAATLHQLTFNGRTSILISQGGEALSDPVPLTVNALDNLDVTIYLPGATGPSTQHYIANQTNYLASGDQSLIPAATPFTTSISCWMFLSAVDVQTSPRVKGALAAFGDSITDGYLSTANANRRYTDDLARALAARHGATISVVNTSDTGNELLFVRPFLEFGYSALARFNRDVIVQPGVRAVIVLEGINDIGDRSSKADDLIPVYQQLIRQAHDAGLKIYGGTLTPFGGSNAVYGGDYGTPAGEAQRQLVNAWIRTSGSFDGVIDFDKALRDPTNPTYLLPAYMGDFLHPNDAGYQKMADTVDLEEILDDIN
jgi:lysophospholipase L1-like esterase